MFGEFIGPTVDVFDALFHIGGLFNISYYQPNTFSFRDSS